jgi:chemotaxis protein CheD
VKDDRRSTRGAVMTAAAAPAAPPADATSLQRLRDRSRRPGEASFFFYDARLRRDAVKVLPGEYFVHDQDLAVCTTLGSCIAACLWDRERRVGGLNHFMLPDGTADGADAGRYGTHAMELLVNALLARGAARATLEAKVFGGAAVVSGMQSLNVGEQNTRFVLDYLRTERIPVISHDVLGVHPRKLVWLPASGTAMVKRLALERADAVAALEHAASLRARPDAAGGTVELF